VKEADQQILTTAVMHEVGMSVPVLWVHYFSIGGRETKSAVAAYLNGFGVLSAPERDLLSQALNELIMDSSSSLQAPCSDAPLAHEPGS
jgi:hypothetical protein